MAGQGEGAAAAAKAVAVIKDLRLCLWVGLTIWAAVLLFVPGIAPTKCWTELSTFSAA